MSQQTNCNANPPSRAALGPESPGWPNDYQMTGPPIPPRVLARLHASRRKTAAALRAQDLEPAQYPQRRD
jgi:hypothetical protein